MSKLTAALVAEKLTAWTPSCQVQELLGMDSMDAALFKEELHKLEASGVIIRDGVRRGLKFKFAGSTSQTVSRETSTSVATSSLPKKEKKHKPIPKEDARDIECEATIVPRHEYIDVVTKASITQLLSFVLNVATENRTLSIKRTPKGIIVKTYKEVYCLSDVFYTKENFMKLLKASNISLD